MYDTQKVSSGNHFLLRIPNDKGGPGNPSAPIDFNAFRATNFWSRFGMRGAEIHGNKGVATFTHFHQGPHFWPNLDSFNGYLALNMHTGRIFMWIHLFN